MAAFIRATKQNGNKNVRKNLLFSNTEKTNIFFALHVKTEGALHNQ
jgi:hypothetical protein